MSYKRKITREVRVGDVKIGGNNPISVQSMTNTDTRDVEKTVAQIKRLEEAGCDIVRVAVVDMDAAKCISKIKEQVNIPLVFMTYVNVIYRYGTEKFMARCVECGISGVIVPDCPYEERDELVPFCNKAGIDLIPLIAPTSEERITKIAKSAEGFVYVVSSLGVTGIRQNIATDLGAMTKLVKEATDVPCAIGFGIAKPEQAKNVCQYADGAIVGSAIVKIVAEHGKESVPYVGEYVKSMKDAIR